MFNADKIRNPIKMTGKKRLYKIDKKTKLPKHHDCHGNAHLVLSNLFPGQVLLVYVEPDYTRHGLGEY